jgi:hypothetical protein
MMVVTFHPLRRTAEIGQITKPKISSGDQALNLAVRGDIALALGEGAGTFRASGFGHKGRPRVGIDNSNVAIGYCSANEFGLMSSRM